MEDGARLQRNWWRSTGCDFWPKQTPATSKSKCGGNGDRKGRSSTPPPSLPLAGSLGCRRPASFSGCLLENLTVKIAAARTHAASKEIASYRRLWWCGGYWKKATERDLVCTQLLPGSTFCCDRRRLFRRRRNVMTTAAEWAKPNTLFERRPHAGDDGVIPKWWFRNWYKDPFPAAGDRRQ